MEQLGTDFNATGSVMSRAELEEQRRKRGECITCGRKCFVKKLFKMIPITDHGRVLNGRCLNCHPLDATDGALPAVSRPATEADLARFTRSQNNLRGSITQGSNTGPPPPEQRQGSNRSQQTISRNTSQSNMSNSSGSQRHAMVQRQSVTSYTSASGDSAGSGSGGNASHVGNRGNNTSSMSMDNQSTSSRIENQSISSRIENQSISSRTSSRDRHPSPLERPSRDRHPSPLERPLRDRHPSPLERHSVGSNSRNTTNFTSANRPEAIRTSSIRSMSNQQHFGSGASTALVGVNEDEGSEFEHEELSCYSINDESTFHSGSANNQETSVNGGREYYHRNYHSSRSMGSQGSDTSPNDGSGGAVGSMGHHVNSNMNSTIESVGTREQATNSRRPRRPPSRENSYDGLPSSRRRPSAEPAIRRPSDASLNTQSYHGTRRASSFDQISEEDRISLERAFGSDVPETAKEARRRASHSVERYSDFRHTSNPSRETSSQETSIRPSYSNSNIQDLVLQSVVSGGSASNRHDDMANVRGSKSSQQNAVSSRDMEGGRGRNSHSNNSESDAFRRLGVVGHDFPEIMKCMQDYHNSIEVQTCALQTISNIELSVTDCMLLSSAGVIQIILDTMDGFPDDLELQVAGCSAIWNASATPENQIAFVDFGAIEVIMRAMSAFPNDAVLQEQALAVLANLGANEDNLGKILESGVIERLIETLGKHASNADVQIKGCLALSNFASHPTDYTRKIIEAGGGSAIVISMVLHPNNAELQERALRGLRNLSAKVDQNRLELTNIGGIDAIISAMQVHRDSADIQQIGAWTLSNLAGNDDVRTLIGDCGGIDVIIRAMWVHNDKVPIQEWCSRALFSLSSNFHNSKLIMELGGVSAIVNAMQAHVDAVAVQEMGCSVLCNLATDQQSKMRIVDEEALDAVVLAMVLFSDDAKVQEHSCQLLLQLAIAENFKAMQASNVGELVVAAARKFPGTCAVPAERLIKVIEGFLAEYL